MCERESLFSGRLTAEALLDSTKNLFGVVEWEMTRLDEGEPMGNEARWRVFSTIEAHTKARVAEGCEDRYAVLAAKNQHSVSHPNTIDSLGVVRSVAMGDDAVS